MLNRLYEPMFLSLSYAPPQKFLPFFDRNGQKG